MKAFTLCAALLLPFIVTSAAAAAPRPGSEVVIINTGDRFTPGYRVTVEPNGALASTLVPRGQRKPIRRTDRMIAVNRQRFFADLASAAPLNQLPAERRGPAPKIFIRYQGQLSSNLRAASRPAGRTLYQDVKKILQVLRLPIPNAP